jgi:predicted transcriptional regulator
MREAHVGDLVVTETRHGTAVPIGMITDRDLVIEILAEGVDPKDLRIADVMSGDLVTVEEDNGLEFALREMGRKGLRRLPVVDCNKGLVGILSIDDVVDHVARLAGYAADAVRTEQQIEAKARP